MQLLLIDLKPSATVRDITALAFELRDAYEREQFDAIIEFVDLTTLRVEPTLREHDWRSMSRIEAATDRANRITNHDAFNIARKCAAVLTTSVVSKGVRP